MAGTIEVGPGLRWSAATWVFDFVLRAIAAEVNDRQLAGDLIGIQDENLGWLSLVDLPEADRAQVERVVRDSLITRVERDLPDHVRNRADVVGHIRRLVALLAP